MSVFLTLITILILFLICFALDYFKDKIKNKKLRDLINYLFGKKFVRILGMVLVIGDLVALAIMFYGFYSTKPVELPPDEEPPPSSSQHSDPTPLPPKERSLLEIPIVNRTEYVLVHDQDSKIEDLLGNIFDGGSLELQCGYSSRPSEITYRLNGKYSSLKCTISKTGNVIGYDQDLSIISDTKLVFIGDGERIWFKIDGEYEISFPLNRDYSEPVNIEVPLKGIKELKIVKPIDYMWHMNNILIANTEIIQTNEDYLPDKFDRLKDKQVSFRQYEHNLARQGWQEYVTLSNGTYWYDSLVMDKMAGEYDFNLNGEYRMLKAFCLYTKSTSDRYEGNAEFTFMLYDKSGNMIREPETILAQAELAEYMIDVRGVYSLTILSNGDTDAVLAEPRLVKYGQPLYLPPP